MGKREEALKVISNLFLEYLREHKVCICDYPKQNVRIIKSEISSDNVLKMLGEVECPICHKTAFVSDNWDLNDSTVVTDIIEKSRSGETDHYMMVHI